MDSDASGNYSLFLNLIYIFNTFQSEKQFYLDQAKQLKETFNSKYPDYVYRRRPNNSRKRRRSDGAAIRPVDHALLVDHTDDLSGSFDVDASPTDDDQLDATLYHRSPQAMSHTVIDQKFNLNHPRSSLSHSYSSSEHFRSNSQDGHRLSYGSNSNDRVGPGMTGNPSSGMGLNSLPYSYGQSPGHTQSSPVFGADSVGSQQGWQHRGGSWVGSGQDRIPPATHAKNSYSPPGSWSSPNDSTSSAASGTSNFFPMLNTPFYPNQSSSPPFITSSNSHQQSNSTSQYESVSTIQARELPRSYGGSTSGNSYSLGRDPFFQRTLPPMQLSSYSPSQPLTSSGSSGPSPASLWRD